MKRSLSKALAIASVATLPSMGAIASDGTITFAGTVTDSTCSINGVANGTASDLSVVLPTVSAGSLPATGATAGTSKPSDIHFSLTGCTGAATKVVARFENGPNVDQTTGNLMNQASSGAATNVQVQLLNGVMQPINITTNTNNQAATNGATIASGNAVLTYYARYYATGAATAGAVSTSVQYTMDYQ